MCLWMHMSTDVLVLCSRMHLYYSLRYILDRDVVNMRKVSCAAWLSADVFLI